MSGVAPLPNHKWLGLELCGHIGIASHVQIPSPVLIAHLRLVVHLVPASDSNVIPSRPGQCNIHRPQFPRIFLIVACLLEMHSGRKFQFGKSLAHLLIVIGVWPRFRRSLPPSSALEPGSPNGLGRLSETKILPVPVLKGKNVAKL